MTDHIDPSGLNTMLSQTLSALGKFQAQPGDQPEQEAPAGTGEAADGLVQVRAVQPGQIEGLVLDSRVMRMSSQQLAQEIETAVNAALADLRQKAVVTTGVADLSGLNEQLKAIQSNAERQFSTFTASMVEAQEQLARRAGGGQ